jgi:flagellar biosynthesis chaperone FliJ
MTKYIKFKGAVYRLAARSVQAKPNAIAQLSRIVTTLTQAIQQIENVPSLYREREQQNEAIESALGSLNSVLTALEDYHAQLSNTVPSQT